MNKGELIDTLATQTGRPKTEIGQILDALLETVVTTVAQGDAVQLVGFGAFEIQHRAARSGRNPQTGEPIAIPAASVPKFTPGAGFRKRVAESQPAEPPAVQKKKARPAATEKPALARANRQA